MKKLLLGSLALATFALSSCTDENEAMLNSINEVFSGEIVSSGSRTTMGDNGSVVWSDGDAINLFKKTGYYQKYMVENGGSTSADFVYANEGYKGARLDKNYAVYPYNANNTINGTTISVDLSTLAAQEYTENSFQNGKALMVAKSDNTTLQFSNTLAVLRFDLSMGGPIMDATIESIKISSTTGRALTGNATIDMSQAEKQPAVIADNVGTEITLTANVALSETAATPFYVMLPAGEYAEGELKVEIAAVINEENTVAEFQLPAVNIPRSVITTFTYTFDTEVNGNWNGTTDENYTSVNEEQLREVFENGGSCALTSDLELEQPLTLESGKDVVLDLNGFTLKYSSNAVGNQDMMLVNGNLTVKNGSIEYVYTGANQGWNAMTTIFNITAGGVVNLEGVTAKNLGGSDMAFVAHLNNWGEVTLNVENSTLESPYVAVRVFNSGYDMNNVKIENSTLKGKYCFWVHNYTLADFGNDEAKTAAQQALLNVNISNGNTYEYTGYAPIRLGMTNSIYRTENGERIAASLNDINEMMASASEQSPVTITLGANIEGTVVMKSNVTINGNNCYQLGSVNLNGADNVTLKNITFDAANAVMGYEGAGVEKYLATIISRGADNKTVTGAKNLLIEGCTFTGTFPGNGGVVTSFADQGFTGSHNVTIKNCIFDVQNCGYVIYGYYFGSNLGNFVIEGNTFKKDTYANNIYLGRYASNNPVLVKDNIFEATTTWNKAFYLQSHSEENYNVSYDASNNTLAQ